MSAFRLLLSAVFVAAILLGTSSAASAAPPDCHERWLWSYAIEVPQGFWSTGWHTYQFRAALDGQLVFTPGPVLFQVTSDATIYRGQAQLRFYAVRVYADGAALLVSQINAAQDTAFEVNDDIRGSKAEADAYAASETFEVTWDGQAWTPMRAGPVVSFCSFDPLRLGTFEREWGPLYRP